jgi:hypothetical protein
MLRLSRMGLALVGLALVVPTASWAGDLRALLHGAPGTHRPRHLCAKCQERLRQGDPAVAAIPEQVPTVPGATVDGECQPCQMASSTGPVLVGDGSGFPVVSQPMLGASTNSGYSPPGHAVVGGPATTTDLPPGSPWAGSPMMMTGGSPYGPAPTGEMVISAEPAPIGVVQTGFRAPSGMPTPAGPAAPGPWVPAPTPAAPSPIVPGVLPGQRRPHILAHLFGLSGRNRYARAWDAQRRADHAAISYGPAGQVPSQLPASMVYGR